MAGSVTVTRNFSRQAGPMPSSQLTSTPIPTGFEIAAEISVPSSICSRISSISCSTLSILLGGGVRKST